MLDSMWSSLVCVYTRFYGKLISLVLVYSMMCNIILDAARSSSAVFSSQE